MKDIYQLVYLLIFSTDQFLKAADKRETNIARGKPTRLSTTGTRGGIPQAANRAVDGSRSTLSDLYSCAQTWPSANPWLYVDLLQEERVTHFILTTSKHIFQGFEARVGNSKKDGGSQNDLCIQAKLLRSHESVGFKCMKPVKGRYFYIRVPRFFSLNVCELEIFAEAKKSGVKTEKSTILPQVTTQEVKTTTTSTTSTTATTRLEQATTATTIEQVTVEPTVITQEVVRAPVSEIITVKAHSRSKGMLTLTKTTYDALAGCSKVTFYEGMTTWCSNDFGQVFAQKKGTWNLVDGKISMVSVGGAGVWAISVSNQVYYRQGVSKEAPDGLIWTQVEGYMTHVSSGAFGVLWGISESGRVQCRARITCYNPLGIHWETIAGVNDARHVSCSDDVCWVLTFDASLYIRTDVNQSDCTGTLWKRVPYDKTRGKFISIESSLYGKRTIAVDEKGNLHIWMGDTSKKTQKSEDWFKLMDKRYSYATPANNGYIAIDKSQQMHFLAQIPSCTKTYNAIDKISVGKDDTICGIANKRVYQKQGKHWIEMDGNLTMVSCSENQMWGVDAEHSLYFRVDKNDRNPFGSGWKRVSEGKYKFKNVNLWKHSTVFGVSLDDEVLMRANITQEKPMGDGWLLVPNRLQTISCGSYACWGINYNNWVFYQILSSINEKFIYVPGLSLRTLEVGENDLVVGTDHKNRVWMRVGVSFMNPVGTSWMQIYNNFAQVAPGAQTIYLIDQIKAVYTCRFRSY